MIKRQNQVADGGSAPATGRLRITRDNATVRDKLRAYKIVVDGAVVGKVKRDKSVLVDLAPGRHAMLVSLDWCSSKPIVVEIVEGAECSVECGPNPDAELRTAAQVTQAPDTYLWLRQTGNDGTAS